MPHYSMKILETGYNASFPAGVAFDFWYMSDQQVYSPFAVTLLQGEGHNILFDCGFDNSEHTQNRIRIENDSNCHPINEVLIAAGIAPEDIDSVVISHCHWDHIGGATLLPNAKFYIQQDELENWERAMAEDSLPCPYTDLVNTESLSALHAYVDEGRAVLLHGDVDNLFPGISIRTAIGHGYMQNMLFLDTDEGNFAVIGDVAMRPESFNGAGTFPCFLPNVKFAVGTIEDITASYRHVMEWVGNDITHIIPTHDGTRQDVWPTRRNDIGLNITTICS